MEFLNLNLIFFLNNCIPSSTSSNFPLVPTQSFLAILISLLVWAKSFHALMNSFLADSKSFDALTQSFVAANKALVAPIHSLIAVSSAWVAANKSLLAVSNSRGLTRVDALFVRCMFVGVCCECVIYKGLESVK
jgi:hypothetical protein